MNQPKFVGARFAYTGAMLGGWNNEGSKSMGFGLPFAILSVFITTWFFATGMHVAIAAPSARAADRTVALLGDETDAVDSGIAESNRWEPTLNSERKPDPAADPFLDSTPIRVAHRSGAHRHHRSKHHQKVLHHHH